MIDGLMRANHSSLITGIVDAKRQPEGQGYQFFNSIIVLGDKDTYQYPTRNRYSKHHLVPFGGTYRSSPYCARWLRYLIYPCLHLTGVIMFNPTHYRWI